MLRRLTGRTNRNRAGPPPPEPLPIDALPPPLYGRLLSATDAMRVPGRPGSLLAPAWVSVALACDPDAISAVGRSGSRAKKRAPASLAGDTRCPERRTVEKLQPGRQSGKAKSLAAEAPWLGFLAVNKALRTEFLAVQPRKSNSGSHWQLLHALLEQAAFEPRYIPDTEILLHRGDLCVSERELAGMLGSAWSRDKVRRGLVHLQHMGEIVRMRPSRRRGALIRVVRYNAWTAVAKPEKGTAPLSSQRNGRNRTTQTETAPLGETKPHHSDSTDTARNRTTRERETAPPVLAVQATEKDVPCVYASSQRATRSGGISFALRFLKDWADYPDISQLLTALDDVGYGILQGSEKRREVNARRLNSCLAYIDEEHGGTPVLKFRLWVERVADADTTKNKKSERVAGMIRHPQNFGPDELDLDKDEEEDP